MKRGIRAIIICLLFSVGSLFVTGVNVFGEEYQILKGLKTIKVVFDFRNGNLQSAALHLKFIRQTLNDKNIIAVTKKPDFVVVFLGPSVKLISKNRVGFSAEEQKTLDEIAATITKMSEDGIKLEICLAAAQVFGVDPASVLPEIQPVTNGWISLIGYQAKHYALVPAY